MYAVCICIFIYYSGTYILQHNVNLIKTSKQIERCIMVCWCRIKLELQDWLRSSLVKHWHMDSWLQSNAPSINPCDIIKQPPVLYEFNRTRLHCTKKRIVPCQIHKIWICVLLQHHCYLGRNWGRWQGVLVVNMHLRNTPWKINMEPTDQPFRKEHDLPNLHDYVPCSSSRGVQGMDTHLHIQSRLC